MKYIKEEKKMFKVGKKYGNKSMKAGTVVVTPTGQREYIPKEVIVLSVSREGSMYYYEVIDDMGNKSTINDNDADKYYELDNPAEGLLEVGEWYVNLDPDAGKEVEKNGRKNYIPKKIMALCNDAELSGLSLDSYTSTDDKGRLIILRGREDTRQLISEKDVVAFVKRCDEINKLMWDLVGECEEFLSHPMVKLLKNHCPENHPYMLQFMHDYFKENANDENALDIDLHSATLSDASAIIDMIAGYENENTDISVTNTGAKMKEMRVCRNCSPKDKLTETNHLGEYYKDILIQECCECHFKTYYNKDSEIMAKEDVFTKYPELLIRRKNRINEVKKQVKCDCAAKPEDMWCWNKPWISCEIKTIWEEIKGKCISPISAKEHVDEILAKYPDTLKESENP